MSDESRSESIKRDAPGLARIAATSWLRTAEWAVEGWVRIARIAMDSVLSGERPPGGDGATSEREPTVPPEAEQSSSDALRERGARLLRLSADVDFAEDFHPAYARILSELAPDEARILRLLALQGPQAAVDVRSGLPLASQLVAPGLSMIGAEAGCRHLDRLHAYLDNLNRLGLTWFSREALEDPLSYQVLEAQPDVIEAIKQAGRTGRTVRRSIHLTPFGHDFCNVCLPLDTAEFREVVTEEPRTAAPAETEQSMPAGPLSGSDDD